MFKKVCAQCHKIYGEGQDVGPEITLNGRGSYEQLLSNVFDPSLVIGAAYQATTVATTDGRVLTGLARRAKPAPGRLEDPGGEDRDDPRRSGRGHKVSPLSLMPEDLEKQLKPQELADLFAYITLDKPPGRPGRPADPRRRGNRRRPRGQDAVTAAGRIRRRASSTSSIVGSSVEVPAVRPTVSNPRNQSASRSAADWTWTTGRPRSRQSWTSSLVLFEFRPPTTTTASTRSSSRSSERWWSLVGWQTVSTNRTSAPGFSASIAARTRAACADGTVVWQTTPSRRPDRSTPRRPTRRPRNVPGRRRSPRPRRAPGGR